MKKKRNIYLTKPEIYLICVIFFMEIIMMGMTMNFKVMQSNGGNMPVENPTNYTDDTHFTFQNRSEIPYYYLSDIYYTSLGIYSIGDFIMYFGAVGGTFFLLSFGISKAIEQEQKKKDKKCK